MSHATPETVRALIAESGHTPDRDHVGSGSAAHYFGFPSANDSAAYGSISVELDGECEPTNVAAAIVWKDRARKAEVWSVMPDLAGVGAACRRIAEALGLALLLALQSCIPLGRSDRLSQLAREEWTRVGAPDRHLATPIYAGHCIGSPGFIGGYVWVPWPWSEWDACARIVMRYELSKLAWSSHGADADGSMRWYWPLLYADAFLHGPSELASWWYALFPGDVDETAVEKATAVAAWRAAREEYRERHGR